MDSQDSWLDVAPDRRAQEEEDLDDEPGRERLDEEEEELDDPAHNVFAAHLDQPQLLDLDQAEDQEEELRVVLDEDVSSGEVLHRIEQIVASFIEDICEPTPPSLQLISRSSSNLGIWSEGQSQTQGAVVGLRDRSQARSLIANQGAGAFAFARVFQILEVAHELVRTGRKATQRDIYYKLLCPPVVSTPMDVSSAIQDVVGLLRVPRSSLGICCTPRGSVSGKLYVKDGPMNPWQDCSTTGMAGRSIPGCSQAIEDLGLRCSARYLLVIEKDAIFQALTQDRLFDILPCVLVTAKGMPDVGTRAFCSKLVNCFPALTVLGLVDWNPSGVTILKTYKYGSRSLDGNRFTLPSLKWLGLRSCFMTGVDDSQLQQLTRRDQSLVTGLLPSLRLLGEEAWCTELGKMSSMGVKADIECMYSQEGGMAGLCSRLSQAIIKREYV